MRQRLALSSLFRCERANALVEFALLLPILLPLLLGIIEMARYTILQQKLDKTAFAMADYVTQAGAVHEGDFNGFVRAVPEIMFPYAFDGTVVFSSVEAPAADTANCPAGAPCVAWQRTRLGGNASRIGTQGGLALLPGAYPLATGQDVVVAEVFYNYQPMLIDISQVYVPAFAPHQLYKVAVYKPRQGHLTAVLP